MRLSLISAAAVAALVGYGSSIALVLSAAAAVGATPEQTVSWVLALCVTKAVGSAFLSSWHRVPVVLAWSTPGAALIAATAGITMAEAVGAFLLAAGLVVLTAAVGPLGRLIARIPDAIAGAMLAGVLLPFCASLPRLAETAPMLVLPMVVLFLLVRLRAPGFAVLAALGLGLALAFTTGSQLPSLSPTLPLPVPILPEWRPEVLIGLGLPLYLVTMASQNLPGFATMRAAGFEPPVQSALAVTGGLSALGALFGGHAINMAAITAAICMGDDVHPDRNQRWKVGLAYAAVWVALGLAGPLIVTVLDALPPAFLATLVALGLLAPLIGALGLAYAQPEARFAATGTLLVTAAGVSFFGIGAAFWGLAVGLTLQALPRLLR